MSECGKQPSPERGFSKRGGQAWSRVGSESNLQTAGESRALPLSPCSQENSSDFAHPISPTYTPGSRVGGAGEGVSGRPSGILSPFTPFCLLFKHGSYFAPTGLQLKKTPERAKAAWESSGCG